MFKHTLLILTLCSFPLLSQTQFTINGTVIDDVRLPQIGATVALHKPSDSTIVTGGITKVGGEFSFKAPTGSYYVRVTSVGMEPKIIDNVNVSNNIDLGTITINTSSVLTDEIVVTEEKSIMELKLDKRVYNVNKDASNIGRNGSEILDNIPSVSVDPEGNVSLRGSSNVQILLNGKQSGMVSSDPASIRQLMGDMIEKIEIITNPSARYDAQGEVGIINIVLKKKQEAGYNGNFEVRAGYPDNYGASVSTNYRSESMNLFGTLGANYRTRPSIGKTEQTFFEYDTFNSTNTDLNRSRSGLNSNLSLGSDFFIDDENTLTFSTNIRFGDNDNNNNLKYTDYLPNGDVYRITTRDDDETETKNDVEFNLTYEKIFDGNKDHKLRFDSRYEQDKDVENSVILENNTLSNSTLNQKSYNLEFQRNQLYQLDYIYPFGEDGKFETGAKANLRKLDNDYWVKEEIGNGFEFLEGFNNNFVYYENIIALYTMIGNKIGDFGWQAGVRSEYSDITTELVRSDYQNQRDYINFFPSAHFNYKFDLYNSLQASYSSRIQRPGSYSLRPFFSFTDSRNQWGGNPDLNPEFSDSYELGYLKNWETGSVLSNVYYRHSTDIMQRVTFIDSMGITRIRPSNIGTQNSYGFEFNLSQDITDWWSTTANFNLFASKVTGNESVFNLNTDFFSWTSRVSTKIKYLGYNLQVNASYRAPQDTPQGQSLSFWWLNFGLSKDILDNNGTLTLSGGNNMIWRSVMSGETFTRSSDYQMQPVNVTLTFSYRINQTKQRQRPVFDGAGGEGGGM